MKLLSTALHVTLITHRESGGKNANPCYIYGCSYIYIYIYAHIYMVTVVIHGLLVVN